MADRNQDVTRESFQQAYDLLPMGIVIVDAKGVIVVVNQGLERLLGYERSALVGQTIECLVPKHFEHAHRAMRQDYARNAAPRPMGSGRELLARCRDGREIPVEIGLSPVTRDGERYIVSTLVDVSERRKLEEQLLQVQKEVAVGNLVSGITHDFNNILLGILGHAELAKGAAASNVGLLGNLEVIIENTHRGRDLVGRILNFTRKKSPVRLAVQWETVISDTIRLMHVSLPANVRVHVRADTEIPDVWADPVELQQVFMNVLTNAVHASTQNGGTISVKLSVRRLVGSAMVVRDAPPVQECVCVSVIDPGTGMSPEVLDQVFTPYFTTKPPGKGTGLGLTVTQRIVKSLGGTVALSSREGHGTQIDICIPSVADRAKPTMGDDPERLDRSAPAWS